jgi:hypothetical protein
MTLVKAQIQVLDADAVDPSRGLPQTIEVQFNPSQYQLEKAAQLAEIGIPGIDSPLLQFVRGQNERLTLELFFDTTDQGTAGEGVCDVRDRTNQIYELVKMQPRTHAPPRVLAQLQGRGGDGSPDVHHVQPRGRTAARDRHRRVP